MEGSPVVNAAQQNAQDVFSGQYLNQGMGLANQQNPYQGQGNPFSENAYMGQENQNAQNAYEGEK